MRTINFQNCKSYEDIENTIKKSLQYKEVVADDEAAEEYFRDCGSNDYVYSYSID